jgi:hypothetical protein
MARQLAHDRAEMAMHICSGFVDNTGFAKYGASCIACGMLPAFDFRVQSYSRMVQNHWFTISSSKMALLLELLIGMTW